MTRIVAGRWKGHRLAVPRAGVRPTSDRVREAIFNTLPKYTGDLAGQAVLDLYAGSGALGLEALSRGADTALFVDVDRAAATAIRGNIRSLGAPEASVRLIAAGALATRQPPVEGFDLVLADPPYDLSLTDIAAVLGRLHDSGWLAPDAVIVVESSSHADGTPWPAGIAGLTQRDYGDTRVWYGRATRPDHEG